MNASRIKRPVSRLSRVIATLSALVSTAIIASPSSGAIIYESGTLGAVGIPYAELVSGTAVRSNTFSGVRFQLTQQVFASQIGGHFIQENPGGVFGAIVRLSGPNDFPDSSDFSTPDVLGVSQIAIRDPSAEVFGNLSVRLSPGWHMLVYGSGLFGTNGSGAAPQGSPDIGTPEYVGYQPGVGWFNLADLSDAFVFRDYRFVLKGNGIPEPFSSTLALLMTTVFIARRFVSPVGMPYRTTEIERCFVCSNHLLALHQERLR